MSKYICGIRLVGQICKSKGLTIWSPKIPAYTFNLIMVTYGQAQHFRKSPYFSLPVRFTTDQVSENGAN